MCLDILEKLAFYRRLKYKWGMTKPNHSKADLIPLNNVRAEMVFPTTGMSISERNILNYLEQLGIEAVLQKVNGLGHAQRHVTGQQAEQLVTLFKAKHWRKFKAVEPKLKTKGGTSK